jgi:thymidylate kinase
MGVPGSLSESRTHPALWRLFAEFEERGLVWSLLRVPSDPAAPTGDVDLLVAPADAGALRDVAEDCGFVALPGWDAAPDLLLVSYHGPSDRWLLLDVTTAVSFRSPHGWRPAGVAEQVLARRRLHDAMAVPADADAFWLLLLHCLLDKRVVAPHYRARLQGLAASADDSPVAEIALATAGASWPPGRFTDLVRAGEWHALEQLAAPLAAALGHGRPRSERLRAAVAAARIATRKPLLLRRRRGVNLTLLGPNGVGKSTMAAELQRSYPFGSRVVYMGLWKGAGGSGPRRLTEIAGRPLRLWRNYALAQYHQLRGRLVIFDRYVYEAWLPAQPPWLTLKRAYFWFLRHAVPHAQVAVVLDVPGDVAYSRKQENPPGELEMERRFYAALAGRVSGLEVIDGSRDPGLVRADITAIVWRACVRRWQGLRRS